MLGISRELAVQYLFAGVLDVASLVQVAGAAYWKPPWYVQSRHRPKWAINSTSARRRHRRACTIHRRRPAVAPEKLGSLRSHGWHGASTEPGGDHGNGHFSTRLGGSTLRVASSAAQTAAVHIYQGHRDVRQDHRQLVIGHSGCIARAHVWSSRVICVSRDGRIRSRAYGTWGGHKCRARARGATSVCLSVFSPCFPCCCY